ncbi:MAG: chemotaxis protein CheW [Pirellulales bacterium]
MSLPEPDEIVSSFVEESLDHLSAVEQQLMDIETHGGDIELINTVFRAVHSTKGTAGFLGFHKIGGLAHAIEHVLDLQRNQDLAPSTESTTALLAATDRLRELLRDISHSNDADIDGHVRALEALVEGPDFQAAAAHCETDSAPARGASEPSPRASAGPETSLRVSLRTLDRLMSLAGELVLSRNQLLQVVEQCEAVKLGPVSARIDQVTSELQEAIMQSRMQPLANVFGKFSRVVRDLSSQLGKQCHLSVEGKDVELDKTIIEAIGDPLTHLIRNALDHGIEAPAVRTAKGKPAKGTIRLNAAHRAGQVCISICDDGAGIDAARVKRKALEQGVFSAEQLAAMSERDALRLIFHPGLSTAEKVSDVSGRGVGMDVVKTNIERLGGSVELETQLGQGTKILVTLPLTLAIVPSLLVRLGNERFAVPQAAIGELVRIRATDMLSRVNRIQGAEVLRLRGDLLPLVRLRSALESAGAGTTDAACPAPELHIVVVVSGSLRYGLVVDGLLDSEEIVLKPLGRHLKDCPGLAGATVLGDGCVALILDVGSLAALAQMKPRAEATSDHVEAHSRSQSDDAHSALLFRNGSDEWFAVPMSLVCRVERIGAESIDHVGGKELLQYRGRTLPLISLHEHIRAKPRPHLPRLHVIVFETGGREVGLVVPELVDIRHLDSDVDATTFREPGVAGSVVVDGHVVRLINLFELCELSLPEYKETLPAAVSAGGRAARILLAEDSAFFRKQVAAFLESHGYDVVPCEDGSVAWESLTAAAASFDLVVTDIEMPRLNGFELCRRIRDDARWSSLPVIALTSLAGQEDLDRGREAGLDDHQVKMDRDRLLASVARFLSSGRGVPAATTARSTSAKAR